jgi:hypothetical protein
MHSRHPLQHPRNAALVGLLFVAIAIAYWAIPYVFGGHVDYAGTAMLGLLGIAMAVMSYVLIAGSPND